MTAPVPPVMADVDGAQALDAHWRACYRAEYAHLLHDVDSDSEWPALVVSLVKPAKAAAS